MTITDFLTKFEHVSESAGQHVTRCPAHDDGRASLSIAEGDDGRILLKCHAGCNVEQIAGAVGVQLRDLFPRPRAARSSRGGFNVVKAYDYTDEAGALLFQVCRLDPKGFRQRHRVTGDTCPEHAKKASRDGWCWSTKGLRFEPYRLPHLLEAARAGRRVFVVEGEKDAENLVALGVDATTGAGGAGKWRREYAEAFRGARDVVVLADRDEPGRKHANDVARSLEGIAPTKVLELAGEGVKDASDWIKAGGVLAELEQIADAAPAWRAGAKTEKAGPPTITVDVLVEDMVNAAEAALASSGREVYCRSGELVRTVDVDGRLRIGALPRESLVEVLSAVALWVRIKEEDMVPALPPRDVVGALMARATWPKLRELRAVVDCPTLRADGSVCQMAGYDPVSRVLYVPSTDFPAVPEQPTRAQASAALAEVDDLFEEFPFLAPSDRSAALALLLTVVGRATINGLTPLFATRATAAGTGKTKVVDVAAAVALGLVEAPRLGQPESDEETEKQLVSMGRDASPLALFDNLTKPLGNGVLARALTSRTFTGRLLGRNVMVDVPMPVLAASGNNMQVASDLHRRVLPIDMESKVENPEERTGFRFPDLVAHARAHRPRLLVAALTVLRWWHAGGRPAPATPLSTWGSFEAWSTAIRSPLVLLGRADPCGGVSRLRDESDPEREALGVLLRAWHAVVGGRPIAVAELIRKGKQPENHELRDALIGVDTRWNPDLLEARNAIGQGLKMRRGRIVGGLRLERGSVIRGYTHWCVRPLEGDVQPEQSEQSEAWESDRE